MESKDEKIYLKGVTREPKYGRVVSAVSGLSLGFSIIIAILLGVGIGMWLKRLTGWNWILWLGVFWGIGGACYNLYLAYRKQQKEMDELQNDPKYREYKEIEQD
ncbi:hypothetical protein CQA62_04430 [Helicobacter cholecystus]|uniref:AtpZ/AtpI family protein n=1 Tax=Helicobacter cholecystus TaxID=45498 RepID=A0A3D8IV29_9HELI|nr:AtpZ/AtpI family protein [Helicobacter cholecystus]RDU69082.1 hypothetical protein CQA62_04430 [Helicobacter cholecystus]VEJ24614.1 membrane protein [Helicobacter cholecystus]